MDLQHLIDTLHAEIASLDARRERLVAAKTALEAVESGAGKAPSAQAAQAVRRPRPPSAPVDDDPAATSLLAALATTGAPMSVSAIEATAKTGLSNPRIRKKLQGLATMRLIHQTGTGAGTRYQAR